MKHLMTLSLLMCSFAFCVTNRANSADDGFRPIFDGKTLNGWKGEDGWWKVFDGAIVGESTSDQPLNNNTFLVWDQGEVDDFELRLKFRISGTERANSGIQFRGALRDDGHVIGYQADIDRAGEWIGSLYDEATKRGPLAKRGHKSTVTEDGKVVSEQVADPAELFQKIDLEDWNEYSITAQGNRLILKINGHVTADVTDNDPNGLDRSGVLALQLHSGPPMKIEFKDIQLKRLPLQDGYKKVVFVAGTPSHGYFSHEHNAGCKLLAKKLAESNAKVVSAVYTNGWPKDPTAFDNADTVVSYCDGGGRHYLNDRLEDFDRLVEERGVGLVCLHYAVETVTGAPGEHFLDWIGGYFEIDWSVNPHWLAKFDEFPDHPISNGVEPFEMNDEWYYHMRFQPEMEGVTPILSDLPPRDSLNRPDGHHSGNPYVREAVLERKEPQHVAWAYDRKDGKGRGFGFTGGHFHKNWQDDNFRKVVLNAILWTANAEVPAEGINSPTPTQEELEANQDYPKPDRKNTKAKPRKNREPVAANQKKSSDQVSDKPAAASKVITSQTTGHAETLEANIAGASKLFLIVTDGGDNYSCDWADWAEPKLVGDGTSKKLTELKWKAATSDWGQVSVGKNAGGGQLKINGKPVADGIGTHANSIIEYELPKGHTFKKFTVRGGLDNGGTDQGGGNATSVQFFVFTDARPSKEFLAKVTSNEGAALTQSHESDLAVEQLKVHDDLAVTLFASEPMMTNPASIDVDHLGRVWVCEAVNYRAFRNADVIGDRKQGDRILVLEDTNSDGKADQYTVFFEGHDVDSAHGILILPTPDGVGLRALVSANDSVFFLIDDDGDLKADRKEVLFCRISGAQHDHGIHAFHFGPDGKLYFNFGNEGKQIRDKNGELIVDRAGNVINNSRNPYQEGMVFRCNLDGSEMETLGWNFRNNWEVCVDSFGTMWQSDNDDDGNRGVRINYVMPYGNYGYKDEMTGAGWREYRTGWNDEIPLRHWHLNDPGVVPNLLQTGQGAPTGICHYEGELLPEVFRGQPIHCDAGPNICRAYITKRSGAGYVAETVDILDGTANKWFRPSDVCVAPDGSLIVADWYDPGVGGHRMQDIERGRLFRVVPKGEGLEAKYTVSPLDVSTPAGAVAALSSPNMSRRYLGFTALMEMGEDALPELRKLWNSDKPYLRARALWAIGKLNISADQRLEYVLAGMHDADVDIQITAIRLARQILDVIPQEKYEGRVSLNDMDDALARELLITIRDIDVPHEVELWGRLATGYDGEDRWYLEALGIAAEGQWDECLDAFVDQGGDLNSAAGREIIWRSRGTRTPELLAKIIRDPESSTADVTRYFRAMDFQDAEARKPVLLELAFDEVNGLDPSQSALIRAEALNRMQGFDISSNPKYAAALRQSLDANRGTTQFVKLVDKFGVEDRFSDLLKMAQDDPVSQMAVEAIQTLYNHKQFKLISQALTSEDRETVEKTLTALETTADGRSNGPLLAILRDDSQPLFARRGAVKALGAALPGAKQLLEMAQNGEFSPQIKDVLAATLNSAQWRSIREPAAKVFPPPPGKDTTPLPSMSELVEMSGDIANGRVVFHTTGTCNKCHQVNGIGQEVGPDLSEIGKKLSRPAMFESILYPSAGISHNYENWMVLTLEGQVYSGLLVSESDTELKLKDEKGIIRTIPIVSIEAKKKQDISLMPGDLQKLMTVEELVDLVDYLQTLKEKRN
ncbi:NPCBM/NEW2 domain protein [Thalassoglobus neptunius]|uniref:NPCBM/NEW2 domain protein n=2 Tax=Thalassoglobus neptunius TaxID=1938619 RepID=A0A5C5X1X6_9PLAN|nr:NPCBM/NEW2 domain protein [Thalassoglobus neptunius]